PQLPEGEELPGKDVVLVADTSGSMQGPKIEQARKALRECLVRLRPSDRFALISFSDYASTFENAWMSASKENLQRGEVFINALQAAGGTNIGEALQKALSFPAKPGRVRQVLFATDGQPTVGVTDTAELLKLVAPSPDLPRIF